MAHTYLLYYTLISIVLAMVDFHFAVKAFRKPDKIGRALGWSALFAGEITLAYLLSVNTKEPMLVSIASSLTFVGIDCMLVSLAYYCMLATGIYDRRGSKLLNNTIRAFACFDIVVLLANIYTGSAVSFELIDPVGIRYRMDVLYVMHLVFTYFMVAISLAVLILKSLSTPRQYRRQYLLIIGAIGVVVGINALFLFQDENSFFMNVDCSVLGYSIGLYLMYWTAYDYRQNEMVSSLSRTVMENVNQGIVLFDYSDQLIMYNRRAARLLEGVALCEGMLRDAFLEAVGIPSGGETPFSVQCDIEGCVPMRCDYNVLRDARDGIVGRVYAFTDITREKDITTGFEYAKDHQYVEQNADSFPAPTTVLVFDIIGLREINRVEGRDRGDSRIRALAKNLRRCLPENATFLRGYEAYLIALCPGCREENLGKRIDQVVQSSGNTVIYGMSATGDLTLPQALQTAYRSIQVKKLLNPSSSRSHALASLVRALKEADADTEDHVRRTQRMGALLGERIGLTDAELSHLKLLCLLHDIGKIGIPLEILNKPGKLADQEWEVLRTHPDKGYQIAMSSEELKPIARMILCHHERWDGRGYPNGLIGGEIPVLSRIISIVDAYDAMVNDRSYRKALKPEAAQEEIRVNAGTQFDPDMARQFLLLLEEHPELALGEKVGEANEESADAPQLEGEAVGLTVPIAYSRYILDAEHTIIDIDERFQELTGYTREETVGKLKQPDLLPIGERAYYILQVSKQLSSGDMAYLRHEIQRKDGVRIQVACCGRRYFDSAAKSYRNEIIVFQL